MFLKFSFWPWGPQKKKKPSFETLASYNWVSSPCPGVYSSIVQYMFRFGLHEAPFFLSPCSCGHSLTLLFEGGCLWTHEILAPGVCGMGGPCRGSWIALITPLDNRLEAASLLSKVCFSWTFSEFVRFSFQWNLVNSLGNLQIMPLGKRAYFSHTFVYFFK